MVAGGDSRVVVEQRRTAKLMKALAWPEVYRRRWGSQRKTTVVNGVRSGVVADGSGSKAVAHVEDVEAEVMAGFDGDGGPWTAVAMTNSASAARAYREWEGEAMARGGNEMGWGLS
jgi:hypothetical protein